jgi:hypothetical protein
MTYKGIIGPGKIVLYAAYKPKLFTTNYREAFGRLQRIFTRDKWTHTAQGFFSFAQHPETETLFESNEIQNVTLWDPHTTAELEIYNIKWYTQTQIESALWKTFREYNGESYGFFQILYFVRRYIWETKWIKKLFWWIPTKIFGKPNDIRRWNNWFVGGTICSELFYDFMSNLNKLKYHDGLDKMLRIWNKNNFHAGDSKALIAGLPEIFELEYHKDGGIIL